MAKVEAAERPAPLPRLSRADLTRVSALPVRGLDSGKFVALVAHNNMKKILARFVERHVEFFRQVCVSVYYGDHCAGGRGPQQTPPSSPQLLSPSDLHRSINAKPNGEGEVGFYTSSRRCSSILLPATSRAHS